jgi:hypothetical protein
VEAKIHHYVPKFLIKNFGMGKKDQVWVYDKTNGRSFAANAKNVASENKFYEFEAGGSSYSLESSLSKIESRSKDAIDRILGADSTGALSGVERSTLCAFLALQLVRTKAFRSQFSDMPGQIRERLGKSGDLVEPGSQAAEFVRDPTESEVKLSAARMLADAPSTYGPHFQNKVWLLAKTSSALPFLLGDNPISLQNHADMGPYSNLGLAVKGIEIYLPLSSTRALAMWCPSIASQVTKAAATLKTLPKSMTIGLIKDPDGILELDAAVRTGGAVGYKPQNVVNFNALQIGRSERYVFSSTKDFSLADEMIRAHPELKKGPRMVMG